MVHLDYLSFELVKRTSHFNYHFIIKSLNHFFHWTTLFSTLRNKATIFFAIMFS
jgi:hypothetical protein